MKYLKLVASMILLTVLSSCNNTIDLGKVTIDYDCTFVQNDNNMDGLIDDTERMIMNECMENSLSSKTDVKNNLLGEWELTGHGEGWLSTISKPCGYINFSRNRLTFEFRNNQIDTIARYQWDIEEVDLNGGQSFRLKIISEDVEGLFINRFCENYMYGDATPSDGNMYLYTKVK